MTFWEHIGVLRKYILLGGIFFLISTGFVFAYIKPITKYLLAPLHGQTLIFLAPTDPFFFEMHISFVGGMVISFPLWIFLLSRFAGDAFPKNHQWKFLWFVFAAALAGFLSLFLSYQYLVPISFHAFTSYLVPGTQLLLTADSYINFFFLVSVVSFVIVELPILITALAYTGLVNPYWLTKQRRYLYLGILILLGIITPTPDALTLLAVTVPALLFTELGLLIGKMLYTKDIVKLRALPEQI